MMTTSSDCAMSGSPPSPVDAAPTARRRRPPGRFRIARRAGLRSPRSLPRDGRPGRVEAEHPAVHRAGAVVRPWKIAGTDQELPRDLAAGEAERPLEQLHPLRLLERMV